jgi:hypothetical protein
MYQDLLSKYRDFSVVQIEVTRRSPGPPKPEFPKIPAELQHRLAK